MSSLPEWRCPQCGYRMSALWTNVMCGKCNVPMSRMITGGMITASGGFIAPRGGLIFGPPSVSMIPAEPVSMIPAEPELAAQPFTGWRLWTVKLSSEVPPEIRISEMRCRHEIGLDPFSTEKAPYLRSIGIGPMHWNRPVHEAEHVNTHGAPHDAPAFGCMCGMWAFKHEMAMIAKLAREFSPTGPAVWGTVRLWGRVIEHTGGYRAQYAQPLQLKCNLPQEQCELLADAYQCEVVQAEWPREALEIADKIRKRYARAAARQPGNMAIQAGNVPVQFSGNLAQAQQQLAQLNRLLTMRRPSRKRAVANVLMPTSLGMMAGGAVSIMLIGKAGMVSALVGMVLYVIALVMVMSDD